jgi:hypothetical protein
MGRGRLLFRRVDETVDTDDRLFARLFAQRGFVGEVGDVPLKPAFGNQADGSASLIDLFEDSEDPILVLGRQPSI